MCISLSVVTIFFFNINATDSFYSVKQEIGLQKRKYVLIGWVNGEEVFHINNHMTSKIVEILFKILQKLNYDKKI